MNFLALNHAIALFLSSATAFIVGSFVLSKSRGKKMNLAYAIWSLSVAWWALVEGLIIISSSQEMVLFYAKFVWISVVLIAVSTAHFVALFLDIKFKKWFIRTGYVLSAFFAVISFVVVPEVREIGYIKFFPKENILVYSLAFTFIIYVIYQLYHLFKALRYSSGIRRNQIAYVFWASVFGYTGGVSNFMLAFGIYIPFIHPFATYFLILYSGLVALAILKFQLMDIKVVIKKTLLYSIGIALVSGFIVTISFLSSWLTDKIPGFNFWIVPIVAGFVTFIVGRVFWDKSKEVDKLKYEFITIAAHKLRTPLTEIKWAAGALQDKNIDELEKNRLVSEILKADDKLIDLTNELLTVSKAEAEQSKYNLKPVDLEMVVQDVINDLEDQAKAKDIKLIFNYEKNLPQVNVDKKRISSVIQILLENAILYTKDEIKINIDSYKNNIIFHIEDNGMGILKEDQPYIFSKFYRSHEAYLVETEGTGIGLFLAKSIIDKHDGKIGTRSEGKDKGSTFWFSLKVV